MELPCQMCNCLLKAKKPLSWSLMSRSPWLWLQLVSVLEHVLCCNSVWPCACFVLQLHGSLIFPWSARAQKTSAGLQSCFTHCYLFLGVPLGFSGSCRVAWMLWMTALGFFLLWLIYISVSVDWSINLNSCVISLC